MNRSRVLLLGGSGFLGRGLLRRAKQESWDCEFTVFSRGEAKQEACRKMFPEVRYVLGDIRDTSRLHDVCLGHDTVVHASALKVVPRGESDVFEFIDVNILGSMSVIEAVKNTSVTRVVAISTDKSALPVNTYGLTKAVMERLFGEAGVWNPYCDFIVTRYGNVIGSTGSVIPMFFEQLERQGFIELTDPKMSRFWLTVDEAVDLIEECLETDFESGTIIIPRPAAMSMGDLANAIVSDDESKIKVVGLRPGEKMDELLLHYQESARAMNGPNNRYYLMPPHVPARPGMLEPFTLASHSPARWLTRKELLDAIEDARTV